MAFFKRQKYKVFRVKSESFSTANSRLKMFFNVLFLRMDNLVSLLKKLTPDLTPGYLKEFHAEVFAAVKDGKLTEEEIATLESKKEELGLTEDALSAVKQELYVAAFQSIHEDRVVTDDEWDELQHIQDYLGLSDQEIAKTKKDLYRMRIMSEIKKGNLPVAQTDLLVPDDDELVHWAEPVDIALHSEPADQGHLVITSKRIVLRGNSKTTVLNLTQMIGADCTVDGAVLHVKNRQTIKIRYRTKGNHNIAGSILLHAIAGAKQ